MSFKADTIARLFASPAVVAFIGDRAEWDQLAPDSEYPAVMLQVITDTRPQNHDGFDLFRPTRVQVNCLAGTAAEADALLEAVIEALVPPLWQGDTIFLRSFIDGGASDAENTATGRLCRARTDIIIWHN